MWTWKDENAFESVRSLTGTFWVSGIFFLPPEVPLLRTYQVVYLHTPPSFLTKKRRSWELEGGSFLFFFPFWKLQRPVQPAASHPLQLWLSWHPDASHEAGVWYREYRVLDRSCLFFFLSWCHLPETPKWSLSLWDFLQQFLFICSRDADI